MAHVLKAAAVSLGSNPSPYSGCPQLEASDLAEVPLEGPLDTSPGILCCIVWMVGPLPSSSYGFSASSRWEACEGCLVGS